MNVQSVVDDQNDRSRVQKALAAQAHDYRSMLIFVRLKRNVDFTSSTYRWYDDCEWPGAGSLVLRKINLFTVGIGTCSIHLHIKSIAMPRFITWIPEAPRFSERDKRLLLVFIELGAAVDVA